MVAIIIKSELVPWCRQFPSPSPRRREIIISGCTISEGSEMKANCLASASSADTLDGTQIAT